MLWLCVCVLCVCVHNVNVCVVYYVMQSLYSGTNKSVAVAQRRDNRAKNCFSNFYPCESSLTTKYSSPAFLTDSQYNMDV